MAHCGTKRMKKGHGEMVKKPVDGNAFARREYAYGGDVKMSKGGQPKYKHGECPKGKPC